MLVWRIWERQWESAKCADIRSYVMPIKWNILTMEIYPWGAYAQEKWKEMWQKQNAVRQISKTGRPDGRVFCGVSGKGQKGAMNISKLTDIWQCFAGRKRISGNIPLTMNSAKWDMIPGKKFFKGYLEPWKRCGGRERSEEHTSELQSH